MHVKATSSYKTAEDKMFLEDWNRQVQSLNGYEYERIEIQTSLGKTVIWGINSEKKNLPALVFFPGARTCAMFLDLDNALGDMKNNFRIFLVEANGQPSLSDGNSPEIKSDGYGLWAKEVLQKLGLEKANIAGASLGGLICLRLCIVAPGLVEKVILLNPAGISPFSMLPKNLFYNILPLVAPSRRNVEKFLDKAVFYGETHRLPQAYKDLVVDYEVHALTRFNAKAQNPAKAIPASDLQKISSKVYLVLGDKDLLFPTQKTIAAAKEHISSLQEVVVLPNVGHGIETSKDAMRAVERMLVG